MGILTGWEVKQERLFNGLFGYLYFKHVVKLKSFVAMDADVKLEVIQWLANLQDEVVWEKFVALKQEEEKKLDWWDELKPHERQDIEEGLQGNSLTFEQVRKNILKKHGI